MHKRRQIADANPKNLTHFSGNSISSSNVQQTSAASVTAPSEFRPMKSIIIGAGQPIVIPGQKNVTNETSSRSSTPNKVNLLAPTSKERSGQNDILDLSKLSINEQKVVSVEEFCPDGGALDKSFLDDLPAVFHNNPNPRQLSIHSDPIDSDSDNENGNPLVAKFHEDPSDDVIIPKLNDNQSANTQPIQTVPKVNPLAKNKIKINDFANISTIITARKTSISSDDIEMPVISKTNDNYGTDIASNEEFDSWLSDPNQRRSPEGGEDVTTIHSADRTSIGSDNQKDSDDKVKEKKHKSKKKKSKNHKHDKEGKDRDKKKSRRSKEIDSDEFLNGNGPTINEILITDGTYEAI